MCKSTETWDTTGVDLQNLTESYARFFESIFSMLLKGSLKSNCLKRWLSQAGHSWGSNLQSRKRRTMALESRQNHQSNSGPLVSAIRQSGFPQGQNNKGQRQCLLMPLTKNLGKIWAGPLSPSNCRLDMSNWSGRSSFLDNIRHIEDLSLHRPRLKRLLRRRRPGDRNRPQNIHHNKEQRPARSTRSTRHKARTWVTHVKHI